MADSKLDALRNRFNELQKKKEEQSSGNSSYYPFFAMDFGKEAIVRFLPDLNEENPDIFMITNDSHTLDINNQKVKVPCMKNYGHKNCPMCDASQSFYKKEGKKSTNGKKYWKKANYLARVLVVKDPIPVKEGSESYEGKICVINLSGDLYAKIMAACISASDPMPNLPCDLPNGCNFIISKEKNGEYASYDNSRFARSNTPISIEIDKEKDIINLHTLLRKEPTMEEVEAKLQAALTNTPYDDGSSAFRQSKSGIQSLIDSTSPSDATSSVLSGSDDTGASAGSTQRYEEILARVKNRRADA